MAGTFSKLVFSNLSKSFPETLTNKLPALPSLHHYYSSTNNNINLKPSYDQANAHRTGTGSPPDPIPNRPLRGDKRSDLRGHEAIDDRTKQSRRTQFRDRRPTREGGRRREEEGSEEDFTTVGKSYSDAIFDNIGKTTQSYQSPPITSPPPNRTLGEEQRDDESMDDFLEKFKLRNEKLQNTPPDIPNKTPETKAQTSPDLPPPEADEIFRKMKETGLIPNAVSMLDGLCKDGLVQEAMKLFGLMREKGTIPEVVIYTAVVEGFCKAHKFDDAKRIFRKMQNNGIFPNAFSFTVLIQGLYKGKRLEDAVDFCIEMIEAGHSPNVVTFAGLVDIFCGEKGVEEAENMIKKLREKGFIVNDKAVREYLDKKGPFSPLVWEAVFGKKVSHRLF